MGVNVGLVCSNILICLTMQDVFRFWLARGVDGFRIDAIGTLFENHYDRDEPRSNIKDALPVIFNDFLFFMFVIVVDSH